MPKRNLAYMEDRRKEIIEAASDILSKKGLKGLSTTEICKVAGISMGALYTHFASKDEIILALAEWTTQLRKELFNFHNARDFRVRLLKQAAEAKSNPRKFRLDVELLSASLSDPRLNEVWQSFRESQVLVHSIRRLIEAGELRADLDPEAAATAIEALTIGLYFIHLVGGKRSDPVKAMRLLLDDMTAS